MTPGLVGRGGRLHALGALLVLATSLAACGDAAEEPPASAGDPEYQGLSREEIEAEATPMTPAVAESLGIVDTTILMQPPMNPDSVVPLDTAAVLQ
jgi:hypothetical protein